MLLITTQHEPTFTLQSVEEVASTEHYKDSAARLVTQELAVQL